LLDTGPLIYALHDPDRNLSRKAKRAVDASFDALAVSAASIFEVRILGRRRSWDECFRYDVEDFNEIVEACGIIVLPVTGEIYNRAADYPLDYRDHFDKLIAATAEVHGLDLISEDQEIERLGAGWNRIW
jgi:PIN domain nuclease of toxin-antitoxin system